MCCLKSWRRTKKPLKAGQARAGVTDQQIIKWSTANEVIDAAGLTLGLITPTFQWRDRS